VRVTVSEAANAAMPLALANDIRETTLRSSLFPLGRLLVPPNDSAFAARVWGPARRAAGVHGRANAR